MNLIAKAIVVAICALSSLSVSARTVKRDFICNHPQMEKQTCKTMRANYTVIHDTNLGFESAVLKDVFPQKGFTQFAQCIAKNWTNDFENPVDYSPRPGSQTVTVEIELGNCPLEP